MTGVSTKDKPKNCLQIWQELNIRYLLGLEFQFAHSIIQHRISLGLKIKLKSFNRIGRLIKTGYFFQLVFFGQRTSQIVPKMFSFMSKLFALGVKTYLMKPWNYLIALNLFLVHNNSDYLSKLSKLFDLWSTFLWIQLYIFGLIGSMQWSKYLQL